MGSFTGMEVLIDAPVPKVRPGVLLDVATVLDVGGKRWQGGVKFVSFDCTNLPFPKPLEWCDDDDTDPDSPPDGGTEVTFHAFSIWAKETCSTITDPAWLRARNQIRQDVGESGMVALELTLGVVGPNIGLIHAAYPVTTGPVPVGEAMQKLELSIASYPNVQATIHVHPALLGLLCDEELVDKDPGGPWMTKTGHLLSIDAGYGPFAPTTWDWENDPQPAPNQTAVGSMWIWASGPVQYVTSEVRQVGLDGQNMDLPSNALTNRLTREALVVFDPCSVLGAEVDVRDIELVVVESA